MTKLLESTALNVLHRAIKLIVSAPGSEGIVVIERSATDWSGYDEGIVILDPKTAAIEFYPWHRIQKLTFA